MPLAAGAPVPTIPAHQLLVFLIQIGLLLTAALLLGGLATKLGLPRVVGELCAGVLVGPSVLGQAAPGLAGWLIPRQAAQFRLLDAVGQVGVLLLVGLSGSEVDIALARRRAGDAARISLGGLAVPLGIGIGLGYLLPRSLVGGSADRTVFALFIGVTMCVSAIPVIAKTLIDMKLLHRNVGQLTLTAGVIDDTFGWLMLGVVSAMATTGVRTSDVTRSVLYVLAVVAVGLTVGRRVVDALLRWAGKSSEAGVTVTTVVIVVLAGAAATQALKLEAVFGAFVCGMLIGSAPGFVAERVVALRTTVLTVFAPLFFAIAGLRMDLTALARPPVLLAAVVVLTLAIVGKFCGAYLGARASRLSHWESLALGAGMNARGVIEVIVASVGVRLGVLNISSYTIVVLVAIVTSVMAPPILRVTMARVEQTASENLRLADRVPVGGPPLGDPAVHP